MTTDNKDFHKKVTVLKHKIFVFSLLLFGYFLYGYYSDLNTEKLYTKAELESKIELEKDIQRKLDISVQRKADINFIENNLENILDCYNTKYTSNIMDVKCDNFPPAFTGKEQIVRNYLMMTGLSIEKMDFDQKLLLHNIVDGLLVDPNSNKSIVSNIGSISFGDLGLVDDDINLYKLRVDMQLNFTNATNFLKFVNNIEKNIDQNNRMLYKIISMDFDIVNHLQPQLVKVSLYAYFYK
ncbi:MAG: hypothetical protein V3575_02390 [Candidatus Absconditabacteria bacterium]